MLHYLIRDIMSKVHFIPAGLLLGLPAAILSLCLINRRRKVTKQSPLPALPFLLFWVYVAFIVVLTLLSRESGSADKLIDLELFSTLKINRRNNAYAVENILLFLPFGFFGNWNEQKTVNVFVTAFWGGIFSLTIETLQLVTARGFFQLDDILTNILGAFLGALMYRIIVRFCRMICRKNR